MYITEKCYSFFPQNISTAGVLMEEKEHYVRVITLTLYSSLYYSYKHILHCTNRKIFVSHLPFSPLNSVNNIHLCTEISSAFEKWPSSNLVPNSFAMVYAEYRTLATSSPAIPEILNPCFLWVKVEQKRVTARQAYNWCIQGVQILNRIWLWSV